MKVGSLVLISLLLVIPSQARTITVDCNGPSDFNDIQAAINDANDGDEVLVADGIYTGPGNRDIDFGGRAITVRSENGAANCIIDCNGSESEPHRGFYFHSGEGPNSVVYGFTITSGYTTSSFLSGGGAIECIDASPTIANCIFRGNYAIVGGGAIHFADFASPEIINCTFHGNVAGFRGGAVKTDSCVAATLRNCIIWGNIPADGPGVYVGLCGDFSAAAPVNIYYSLLQAPWQYGENNIVADPCFAESNSGDYHLKSQAGRWHSNSETWVQDTVTSPAIDGGDPADPIGFEPFPNGGVINMGAYGGTAEASKSYFGSQLVGISPTEFEFYANKDGPNPESQVLSIYNAGDGTLSWEIMEDCNWLEVDPNNGESTGEIDDVNVSVNISALYAGTYNCELTISDPRATNSPRAVAVTLDIKDNDGRLLVPSEYGTIQAAIDLAYEGDTVLVADGIYTGPGNRDIDFGGRAITVRSENGPTNCVIDCNGSPTEPHRAFIFQSEEGPDSVVRGFTITGGYAEDKGGAIVCLNTQTSPSSNPTIINSIFSNNTAGWGGGIYLWDYLGSTYHTKIINCTFNNNVAGSSGGAIYVSGPSCGSSPSERALVRSCIIWGNSSDLGIMSSPKISYHASVAVDFSILQSDWNDYSQHLIAVEGCIVADPCFADPNSGDLHLKSQAGRWNPNSESWVTDANTSVAIDAGDPADPVGYEPFPSGGIINMGAYGGTAEASKSYFGTTPCETVVAGDINGDCKVNFLDFALMGLHWLEDNNP